jgi:hypothetical protein
MCIVCSNRLLLKKNYFFLCLFLRRRFLRLWVAILCFFLFFPLGIVVMLLVLSCPPRNQGVFNNYFKSFR